MKRLTIAVLLIAAAGGVLMMTTAARHSEWTTDSPDALREFELGLEAKMKYYDSEAAEHFARAAEIDADFLAAKLYLSFHEETWDRREALQTELRDADLSEVTPRERFLVEFHTAQWDRDYERARKIAERYVKENPEDVYGLDTLVEMLWKAQDWKEAERLYTEILEIDPNWAKAQNRLGYIALARGRFEEAEELFKTYNYIAPDQANPHDSMGELLVLLGRYDEARAAFERALEIRPDFCNTYQHMIDLVLMEGRLEAADGVLDRATEHCSPRMVTTLRCSVTIWSDFLGGNAERVWSDEREECRREMGEYHFLLHRTASTTGRTKLAWKAERGLKMKIEEAEQAHHIRLDFPRALLLHMEGTRLMAEGDVEQAVEAFRQADEKLFYWGEGQGILKLYNRVNLAHAQEKLGLDEDAAETLAAVRAVNPAFASYYPESVGLF